MVECGTAYRVMKQQTGKHPFGVVAFMVLIAQFLKEKNPHEEEHCEKLTYHAPCQVARNGGVYEEPRYVIDQIASDFKEMTPNREMNWCGGGGGLVAMGEMEFRMKSSRIKAEQVKASGAGMICTICDNCRTQLTDLVEHYELGLKVESLAKLVAHALVKQ